VSSTSPSAIQQSAIGLHCAYKFYTHTCRHPWHQNGRKMACIAPASFTHTHRLEHWPCEFAHGDLELGGPLTPYPVGLLTAITTFLPATVPQSNTAGLLDHTRRGFLTGAGLARSAALPFRNWVAIGFLLRVDQSLPVTPGWMMGMTFIVSFGRSKTPFSRLVGSRSNATRVPRDSLARGPSQVGSNTARMAGVAADLV
jgi:hypothetical protein